MRVPPERLREERANTVPTSHDGQSTRQLPSKSRSDCAIRGAKRSDLAHRARKMHKNRTRRPLYSA